MYVSEWIAHLPKNKGNDIQQTLEEKKFHKREATEKKAKTKTMDQLMRRV